MTDTASERIRIDASADRCFDVAVDFESYPEWLRDVKEAKILEVDDEGRGLRVEFRAAALGKSIRYVLEYDYTAAPAEFSWRFAEGDMLRRLDGTYRFEPEGPALTRVNYDLAVELAMPLPGLVKRRAAGLIMGSALKELKKQVEAVA
jgi:ribosome-associated toxin RatA of RatAB toxin-antitoxin module